MSIRRPGFLFPASIVLNESIGLNESTGLTERWMPWQRMRRQWMRRQWMRTMYRLHQQSALRPDRPGRTDAHAGRRQGCEERRQGCEERHLGCLSGGDGLEREESEGG